MRRISFTMNLPAVSIAAGHRLVLVLGVKGSSDNDLYFVYDHPSYPSFLEVATPHAAIGAFGMTLHRFRLTGERAMALPIALAVSPPWPASPLSRPAPQS